MQSQSIASVVSVRRATDRGHANHGWLDAWHSFSFADYYDPDNMGFRALRVINDDTVAPGKGFGMHPHRSMEIFTYVIDGTLRHEDSMGNGRDIQAGEFQVYMSAGNGVLHSEINPSAGQHVHLLQIWITPSEPGGEPRYQDFDVALLPRRDGLAHLASPDGREGSIAMRQNADIYHGALESGRTLTLGTEAERPHFWLHLVKGRLRVGNETLQPGDAASFEHGSQELHAEDQSEFLLFRLA